MKPLHFIISSSIWLFLSCLAMGQTAVIDGGSEFEQGSKIVLDGSKSDADSVVWIGLNGFEFEQVGEKIFIWAGPGKYSVSLVAGKIVDGKLSLQAAQHNFVVMGVAPVPPVPPVPPNPVPPVPPTPDLTGDAKEAFDAIRASQADPDEVKTLAFDLKAVATQAAALNWTPGEIMADFIKRTGAIFVDQEIKTRWNSYNKWQTQKLKSASGDPKRLIELFYAIADGLEAAIKAPQAVPSSGGSIKDTIRDLKSTLDGVRQEIGQ